MIEYDEKTNKLIYDTKEIPQNNGVFKETIIVNNYNKEKSYYLELRVKDESTYITQPINFINNEGTVLMGNEISSVEGIVVVQLIIRDKNGNLEGKSLLSKKALYNVTKSINAVMNMDYERNNDYIGYILSLSEEMKTLIEQIKNKLKNGEFNGKNGTILSINNVEQERINFESKPIVCKTLFEGNNKIIQLDDLTEYKFLLVDINADGQLLHLILSEESNNIGVIGTSKTVEDGEQYAVNIKFVNHKLQLLNAGFYSKENVWNERNYTEKYYIKKVTAFI